MHLYVDTGKVHALIPGYKRMRLESEIHLYIDIAIGWESLSSLGVIGNDIRAIP